MYRLVTGFVSHLMQKQEVSRLSPWLVIRSTRLTSTRHQYSVLIMGLDNAGKTTFLGTCRRGPDPAAKTRQTLTQPFFASDRQKKSRALSTGHRTKIQRASHRQ